MTVDVVGNGMSRPDVDTGDGSDGPTAERVLWQDAFARDLNAQGYTDVLMLRRENGRDVLPRAASHSVTILNAMATTLSPSETLHAVLIATRAQSARISVD